MYLQIFNHEGGAVLVIEYLDIHSLHKYAAQLGEQLAKLVHKSVWLWYLPGLLCNLYNPLVKYENCRDSSVKSNVRSVLNIGELKMILNLLHHVMASIVPTGVP